MRGLWLKNLSICRLSNFPTVSAAEIETALGQKLFNPCGAFDPESHGFAPAFGRHELVRRTGDVYWMQIKSERKLLPASVVRRALEQRIAQLEAQGRTVGRKYRRELKEDLSEELLAKAFAVDSVMTLLVDPVEQYLVVDTPSTKKAELAVSLLTSCFSGLELEKIDFDASTGSKMTQLLLADAADPTFSVDGTLLLRSAQDAKRTARFSNLDLGTPQVKAHLAAGMTVAALELTWSARINFMLAEPFSVRRIKFLEVASESADAQGDENVDELIDAQLFLQAGELRGLLSDLMAWLERRPGREQAHAGARVAQPA